MEHTLGDWLVEQNKVAIADVDTRRLTRLLREKGAQNGCLMAGEALLGAPDAQEKAIAAARAAPSMSGLDLAKVVSCDASYDWAGGSWALANGYSASAPERFHVAAYDFGIKHNIMRLLADRGCRLTVVPAQMPAKDVFAMKVDGVFLSNGPGDPEPCDYAIRSIREFLDARLPTFGICLGHQLLGLAAGGRTMKMKFGHHGANHPVKDVETGQVFITSQNHGFCVDEKSLPANVRITHQSLFDGSLQGIALNDRPAFSFQGHPEASPGPHDIRYLFDRFIAAMEAKKG
jgi:carbamoyl-phosphate synthase small subunit